MLASQQDPGGWYYTFKPLCTERAIDCSQGSKPFENPAAHRYNHPCQTSVTAHRTLLEMEAPCERSLLAMACDRALTEMRVFKATRVQYDKTKAGAVRSGLTGVPASQLHNELQKKSMRRTLWTSTGDSASILLVWWPSPADSKDMKFHIPADFRLWTNLPPKPTNNTRPWRGRRE